MKTTNYWYSKVFIVIVFALFLIPSVTFAAWYNPFSWSIWSIFKKAPEPVAVQVDTKVSTSTPSVSTSTEQKNDVAPVQKKAETLVTPQPKITQPAVTAPAVESDDAEIIANLQKIRTNANSIFVSRDNKVKEYQAWIDDLSDGQYSEEYAVPRDMIEKVIAIYSDERNLSEQLIAATDKTIADAENRDAQYNQIYDAYTTLYGMASDTNATVPTLKQFINNVIYECQAIEKARIELDTTQQVLAENGINVSGVKTTDEIAQQRAKIQSDSDTFLKNLADTQEKLRGDSKEKVETYLKAIIYSPIGNKGWLNSR